MIDKLAKQIRAARAARALPVQARRERGRDHEQGLGPDPGAERAIDEALAWLGRAQDCSRTADGGVARHYSLIDGWGSSYPETTGYIVPTLVECAHQGHPELEARARRMTDWLVGIQLAGGGFQGGEVDARPVVPVTFNTGQILFALATAVRFFGESYRTPMRRAADWLVATQDPDGCWRRHPTPFAKPGEKAYETHVAWALLEAERVDPGRGYAEAALANVRWALTHQRENGWFAHCCLSDGTQPLTHTLGYALRGVIEAARYSGDTELQRAARRTADGLRSALGAEGFLPGRLLPDWRPAVRWACLTGSVQVAACWLLLHAATGDEGYLESARAANRFVRRTLRLEGSAGLRGGVKGSFPVDGAYARYQLPNWAAKFMIDANLLELRAAVPAARD